MNFMELDEQTKANITDAFYRMAQSFNETELERQRPHVLMRPKLMLDGDKWCVLYGENLQEGLAGFGATPEQAMNAFDAAWQHDAHSKTSDPASRWSGPLGVGPLAEANARAKMFS